jgi:hypothetical protein
MFHERRSKFCAVLFFFGQKKERGGKNTVLSVTLEKISNESADTHNDQ